MADDDGESKTQRQQSFLQNKEAYHQKRTQEAKNEQRFPVRVPGIVDVPAGSRGPRSLYLHRDGDSFGFTLRHFIIYPPETLSESDGRHAAVGALLTPMDTIFVKYVAQGGPAEKAGLQRGDRILYVNGESVSTLTYSQVVHKIQTSPPYLHLLVVPKEEDILQKYFSDTAHNPISNQTHSFEDSETRRRVLQHDTISSRSLEDSGSGVKYGRLETPALRPNAVQQQKSADNIYSSVNDFVLPYQRPYQKSADNLYSTPVINDSTQRPRAQPQVPLYRKMGRRSSECATTETMKCDDLTIMKGNMNYGVDMTFANNPTCRMALDTRRRESSSSIGSSATDGSKDSLLSYESSSTLTGHETDESLAMQRLKKSLQEKEEFLRRPSNPTENSRIQKEFYSRPKKLDNPVWPPDLHDSPTRFNKPTHYTFQRVKNDIESEREINAAPNQFKHDSEQMKPKAPKDWQLNIGQLGKIQEAAAAPPTLEMHINGNSSDSDDRRNYPPHGHKIVYKRTKQFETGHVNPEDDPLLTDRTSYYKSELARLSEKRSVPNVAVRTKEFETLSNEPKRDMSASSVSSAALLRKSFRDSRSLDSSGSNCSLGSSIADNVKQLPGNFSIPIGSKFIHCIPPSENRATQDIPNDTQLIKTRARSNSAGSWAQMMQMMVTDNGKRTGDAKVDNTSIGSPIIIQPSEKPQKLTTPLVSITPASPIPNSNGQFPKANLPRPTDLDLGAPKRPMRHLKPTQAEPPPVPSACGDKPLVVRRTKNTNLTDEERSMRRESYLKATEGGRMQFESSELSDGDVSPQLLRSAHRRWRPPLFPSDIQQLRKFFEDTASSLGGSVSGGSSSSASLERDKNSPIEKEKPQFIRERLLHLKITEIDGKRYPDRSWKQVWAVLKGPKLFLYKDRHHQSPVGTSEIADQSLANGVDMRGSCVQVAEDYTKRKNVLRISSVLPCRSELLLQAEGPEELAEWVKTLQEQVATDVDIKSDINTGKQQAVPQTIPAATSIQVQGKSKLPSLRNRSPTGQSPVSKSRKPSQATDPSTSPKSKTWRGRVAKQFRRIQHGASSPNSPTAPEGSTFGNLLEHCLSSNENPYVPKLVEVCTDIVENRGLETIGIYRVPGNSAAVTALTDEVNRSYEEVIQTDPRWGDIHVVSSLLKSFFRKMPDSLLTTAAYPYFIEADNIENPVTRLEEMRKLIKNLPVYHYNTLKHLVFHLATVVAHSDSNKMDAKNLAIVFGPTIVRTGEENMQKMVNDMTHQCKIVESLLVHADWFFSDDGAETLNLPAPIATAETFINEYETNTTLLKDNISKVESLTQNKEQKEKKEFIQSLFSAAQKRCRRKPKDKDEAQSPTGQFPITPFGATAMHDLKDSTTEIKTNTNESISDMPAQSSKPRNSDVFNYKTDGEEFKRRVEKFIHETQSNLSRQRKSECNSNNSLDIQSHQMSSSSSNVRHSLTVNNTNDQRAITKTNSASDVFSRGVTNTNVGGMKQYFQSDNQNINANNGKLQSSCNSDISSISGSDCKYNGGSIRRGSSVENIGTSDAINANGKKIKYEVENECTMHRTNSLDSLSKIPTTLEDGDLVSTITKIFDEKKKELNPLIPSDDNIPYVDESPEKICRQSMSYLNKENIPSSPKLYRNPSLHKSQYSTSKLLSNFKLKEKQEVTEKDEDSSISSPLPDNDKQICRVNSKKVNILTGSSKLRRSESLNKPERTSSPLSNKLKRSESLNKTNDRLKRSDSLTKNEKTESNISKKREISGSRRGKDVFKLKRKNGMPDRSIKRRHTVGGYPDKLNLLDNRYKEQANDPNKSKKEKTLRTSSPDLSSTRRERLFLEVNFIDSENMILSVRQHLIGARPQSFPETVYKVPLESHI